MSSTDSHHDFGQQFNYRPEPPPPERQMTNTVRDLSQYPTFGAGTVRSPARTNNAAPSALFNAATEMPLQNLPLQAQASGSSSSNQRPTATTRPSPISQPASPTSSPAPAPASAQSPASDRVPVTIPMSTQNQGPFSIQFPTPNQLPTITSLRTSNQGPVMTPGASTGQAPTFNQTPAANQTPDTNPPPVAGYRALAESMSSDNSFRIFRRFDAMTIRTLLYLQDELCELEERLKKLDQSDFGSGNNADLVSLHSRRHDANLERGMVLEDIQTKLPRYHKLVNAYASAIALEKPRQLYVDSVRNWLQGKKPTVEEESHFLDPDEDLLSMFQPGGESGNRVLERFIEERWSHLFITKKHKARSRDPNIHYYSKKTIRRVVRTLLTTLAVLLLIGPVVALNYVRLTWLKLLLIAVFAFCFALALALWTRSRNHEIFAALAT